MIFSVSSVLSVSASNVDTLYVIDQSGTYAPLAGSGTTVSLGDDQLSSALPIGFSFDFFGNTYTNFYISSNGFMTFSASSGDGCCSGQNLPNTGNPNDVIAFAWEDLDPGDGFGSINYFTSGTSPNRILVMNFNAIPHYPGGSNGNPVTTQVQLHETSNWIEIHTGSMTTDGGSHTMGIENATGTIAYTVPGRNGVSWSATNDFVRFYCPSFGPNDAGVTSLISPVQACAGTQNVTVNVRNYGINVIDSVTLNWELNGLLQPPLLYTTPLDTVGGVGANSANVVLGSQTFNLGTNYALKVWTSNPNSIADTVNTNDTLTASFSPSLSGTFTIGGTSPDYANFTSAINAISNSGLCGPVIFNVRNGTYPEKITLTEIPGASATNTVTFQSESGDSTVCVINTSSQGSGDNHIILLDGADYVTFKGMTIRNNNTSYGRLVEYRNNSEHNTFQSCVFEGIVTTSTSTNLALIFSSSLKDDDNHFVNNVFKNGSYGLYFYGDGTNSLDAGTVVTGNLFENQYYTGIHLYYQDAPLVSENTIITTSTQTNFYGMYIGYAYNGFRVTKNKVSGANGGFGIYLYYPNGLSTNRGQVANNFVQVGGTNNAYGIYLYQPTRVDFAYNNVLMTNTNLTGTYAAYIYDGSGTWLINNHLVNASGGRVAYVRYTSDLAGSNFNNFYTTGPVLGYLQGDRADLTAWQTSGFDVNSIGVDPQFPSLTDLHTTEVGLNGSGTPFPAVTDDIDGDLRDLSTPDIGANEFTPPPIDGGVSAIVSPVTPFAAGTQDVVVAIKNYGFNTLTTGTVDWEVNGVAQTPFAYSGSLLSGDTTHVAIGQGTFNLGTDYDIKAWITITGDGDASNDTTEVLDQRGGLSGIYTIGGTSPDFFTFGEAVTALTNSGVVDSVIFNVRTGTYNEQISIPPIVGPNSRHTITFRAESGNRADVTLNYSANSSNPYTVRINGADGITFRDMTIQALNGSYGKVVELRSQADDFTLENTVLNGRSTTSSSTNYAVIFCQDGTNHDNTHIIGNHILNGSYGLFHYGTNTSTLDNGLVVQDNHFQNQYYTGMRLYYHLAPQLIGNEITTTSNYTSFFGFYIRYCDQDMVISENKLAIANGGYGIYNINCDGNTSQRALITNNFIQIGGTSTCWGIYLNSSYYQDLYYNNVHITNTNTSQGGLYVTSGGSHRSQNNNFVNTGGGYALYINSTYALPTSDYNNLYATGLNLGYWSGARFDLAAWQTGSGRDANSLSVDPLFTSATDLHVGELALNGSATPIAQVTTDIDGETRNATAPAIGADEYVPLAVDAGVSVLVNPVSPFPAGNLDVEVALQNYGATPITGATLHWEVNGVAQTPVSWTGNLNFTDTAHVVLGSFAFNSSSAYDIKAWSVMAGDGDPANDTTEVIGSLAGLSGVYTIGGLLPDYPTFTAAVNDLNLRGVVDSVIFNVRTGSYNERIIIPDYPGPSAPNTVVFQSETGLRTDVSLVYSANSSQNWTVQLNGADGVTFRNMTLEGLSGSYCHVIDIRNFSEDNLFENNIIRAAGNNSTSTNRAVIFASSGTNNDGTSFIGNRIENGSYGFYYYGTGTTNLNEGLIISGNEFVNQYYMAARLYYQLAPVFSNNTVRTSSGYTSYYGLFAVYCDQAIRIENNDITGIPHGFAIYLSSCDGTSTQRGKIANNFVQIGSTSTAYGIYLTSTYYQDIGFNSVHLTSTNTGMRAFYSTSCNNLSLVNNILANSGGGYAIYASQSYNLPISDHNLLYATGQNLGYWNGNRETLVDWQNASGRDANSLSLDPEFVSSSDLHTNLIDLNEGGLPFAGITTDIDGDARNATLPDIGADEFDPPADDLGISVVVNPVAPFPAGGQEVIVALLNSGAAAQTAVTIEWEFNGVAQTPISWTGNVVTGDTVHVSLGTVAFIGGQGNAVKAWTTLTGDVNLANDTLNVTNLWPALSGVYTIGGTTPNFATFQEARDALVLGGIIGNVTFDVRAGTYTERLSFPEIIGASGPNSIIFQAESGDSTDVILTYSASSTANYTIELDEADGFTFRNMTIRATNGSYGRIVYLQGGADDNRFEHCVLQGVNINSTSTNHILIYSAGELDQNFKLIQNRILYGSYGVRLQGVNTSLANMEVGLEIRDNEFFDQYYFGLYLYYQNAPEIIGNTFTHASNYSNYYGMRVSYCDRGLRIERNKVTAPNGRYGLYLYYSDGLSSDRGLIANNFFHVGGTGTAYGIYSYRSYNQNIYYNSVNITSTNTSQRALYCYYGSHYIRNNSFVNSGGGYAIYTNTTGNFQIIDHNNLYTTGPNLGYRSGNRANLAAWQLATGQSANSISVDPIYNSASDLHTLDPGLDAGGTPVAEVTVDIDGNTRNPGTPDIGADEFSLEPNDAGALVILEPSLPFAEGLQSVVVVIKNFGIDTLTQANVNWSINGTPQTVFNWTGQLLSEETDTLIVGSGGFALGTNYTIRAWTDTPNGVLDPISNNDTTEVTGLTPGLIGTYTIGGTSPDFATFGEAVTALNNGGILGAVTFNVRDGSYNEQIRINEFAGSDCNTPVIFQGESGDSSLVTLNFTPTSANRYVVSLNGADGITFQHMTLSATAGSYCRVVEILNGANCNSFLNNAIIGRSINSTSSNYAGFYSSSTVDDDIRIENNRIVNGAFGIYLFGQSTSSIDLESGMIIRNNLIENHYYMGVYLSYQYGAKVEENVIRTNRTYTNYFNVYANYCDGDFEVRRNYLTGGNGGYGVYVVNSDGSVANPAVIANNFIQVGGTSTGYGIYANNSTYKYVYYNNINITNTNTSSGRAFYTSGGHNVRLKNNIFANTGGGYALYVNSGSSVVESDNNDFYTTGSTLAYWNGNATDLTALRTASGRDANSMVIDPEFLSPTDLHVSIVNLDGAGDPIAGINTDIEGDLRDPQNPDIGADEFSSLPNDAGIISFDAPHMTFAEGTQPVIITLENNGTDTLQTVTVNWSVNDTLQTPFSWTGSILSSASESGVQIGTYDFDPYTAYNLTVWTTDPNGVADLETLNDTIQYGPIYAALQGVYTVGGVAPDFASFTDATIALNNGGVIAPVTFNVRNGVYTEQISLSEILGVSATNTITFQSESGDSNQVTLTYSANSSNRYTVRLNGADYVTFRQMTIKGTNSGYAYVFDIRNGSNHITVENNRLIGRATGSTSTNLAVVYSNGGRDQHNHFRNNYILNGSYGFYFYGTNNVTLESGTIIEDNFLENQFYWGIRLGNQDAPIVRRNLIRTNSNYTNYFGIGMYYCDNSMAVEQNTIYGNNGRYGIYMSNCDGASSFRGRVANNMVQVGGTSSAYGIYSYYSNNQDFFFNNVNISNSSSTNSRAMYLQNGSNLNLRNNVIANIGGGYAIYTNTTSNIVTSEYNDLYTTGTNLGYWSGNRTDLAAWQSASSKDANSISVDPFFISATDLHVQEVLLDNGGIPVPGITVDVDGDLRDTLNPDIGADEFIPPFPNDAGVISIDSPVSPFGIGSQDVFVTLRNFGSDTLTSAVVEWEANYIPQTPFNFSGALPPGGTAQVNIGAVNFIIGIGVDLGAWTVLPNGVPDTLNINDSTSALNLFAGLAGVYTVGGIAPDFVNFSDPINIMNLGGVLGPVTFNVRTGSYVERINLTNILGSSATNRITFQSESGVNSQVLLTSNGTNQANYTVRLNGADYISFRNMTIEATNGTYSRVVDIRNGANSNVLDGNILRGRATTQTTDRRAVVYSPSGVLDNNNQIINNIIEDGSYGIVWFGGGTSSLETGTVITGNEFHNTYYRSIYSYYQDAPNVSGNAINSNLNVPNYRAIELGHCDNGLNVNTNQISSENGGYGLILYRCDGTTGNRGLISNNFIHLGGGANAQGIYVDNCNLQNIYNNSVNITSSDTTAGRAFRMTSNFSSNVNLVNNMFANNGGGYAAYIQYPSGIGAADYNDHYTTGSVLGYWNGGNIADLTAWQTITGMEANSLSVDPLFLSDSDLHAFQVIADSAGVYLSEVPTDHDGEVRDVNNPDIGADEYTALPNDVGIASFVSPVSGCDLDSLERVTVRAINFGAIPQQGFEIVFVFDGDTIVENIDTLNTITPGGFIDYQFFGGIDLFDYGTHTLTAWTQLPTEQNFANDTVTVVIENYRSPGAVDNMLPPDSTLELSMPLGLSWSPGDYANNYDLYVWEVGDTQPGIPTVANITQISHTINSGLDYSTSYNWSLTSKTAQCETPGSVQNFSLRDLPDLVVDSVLVPSSAFSGQAIQVTWNILNDQPGNTGSTQWIDAVYLSVDNTLETNLDTYMGGHANQAALSGNQSYQNTAGFTLPQGISGNYYVIIVTDRYNSVLETDAGNNVGVNVVPLQVTLTPPPDLQVDSILTPNNAFSGQTINISWTVRNHGTGVTDVSNWKDRVYLSQDSILNANNATNYGLFAHSGVLNPTQAYTQTASITLPQAVFGQFYIHILTDNNGEVYEHATENNNTLVSDSFEIFLTPPPDLQVTSVTAPLDVSNKESITINWTVTNLGGSAPFANSWRDRIYLTQNATGNLSGAINLGTVTRTATLTPGNSYTGSRSMSVPDGINGTYYVYVETDQDNDVFEFNFESNNVSRSNTPTEIRTPDLIVPSVTMPAFGNSGQSMLVQWSDRNDGLGQLFSGNWRDRIYISRHSVYHSDSVINLGDLNTIASLAPGINAAKQKTVTIPNGVSGNYYVYVHTDQGGSVYEATNNGNNITRSASTIQIALTPWADLEPVAFTKPDTATAGDQIGFDFTIQNTGDTITLGSTWKDKVYISPDPTFNGNATFIRTFIRSVPLEQDSSYVLPDSLNIPTNLATGNYFLYVQTDTDNEIFEHTDEGNNTLRSTPIFIREYPPVDLVVTNVIVPDSAQSGQVITVSWTVENNGQAVTLPNSWFDAVYLSADSVLGGNDTRLDDWTIFGPLAVGNNYSQSRTVTLPNGASGDYYLLAVTDHQDANADVNVLNNYRTPAVTHITLTPPPDLQISNLTAPVQGTAGQAIDLRWTVLNDGVGATNASSWVDRFYLSTDLVVDGSDYVLGSRTRTGNLTPGQFYEDSLTLNLPVTASGNYLVIVRTDLNDAVYEHTNEGNNTASSGIVVFRPPPADLLVSSIVVPPTGVTGDDITIEYQLRNNGLNPATGTMRDVIYFSQDQTWDINDPTFGQLQGNINIAPQGEITRTVSAELEGVAVGDHYVIIRTDILNNIYENNDTNNTTVSTAQMNVTVPQLFIDSLTIDTLENANGLCYRIEVPANLLDETMLISLTSGSIFGANEMYLRYGNLPTRVIYDYSHSQPFEANQEVLVPNLVPGTYYLLVYGVTTSGPSQHVDLLAEILPFAIRNVNAELGCNTGQFTLEVNGSKLSADMTVHLVQSGDTITMDTLYFNDATNAFVTFDLNKAPAGIYDVVAVKPNLEVAMLEEGFEVGLGGTEDLQVNVSRPSSSRPGRVFSMTVEYTNSGTCDIVNPVLILKSIAGAPISFTASGLSAGDTQLILDLQELNGPPNILRPGASGSIVVYSKSTTGLGYILSKQ